MNCLDLMFLFLLLIKFEDKTGGDLAAYIQHHRCVSEAAARHFMRQLASGLQVLRVKNHIHRDLKSQNLLLSTCDETPVLKIGDFGLARLMSSWVTETEQWHHIQSKEFIDTSLS